MTISGFPLVPSYGELMRVTQGRTRKIDGPLPMAADTVRLFGSQMYFIEAHAEERRRPELPERSLCALPHSWADELLHQGRSPRARSRERLGA